MSDTDERLIADHIVNGNWHMEGANSVLNKSRSVMDLLAVVKEMDPR